MVSRTAPYKTFAPRLVEAGYDVTPLEGKRPILPAWQTRPEAAQQYTLYTSHNIGVLCGGDHHVVAVDIDVLDPDASTYLVDLARDTLGAAPERIGKAPKTLLVYRCSEPFRKIKTGIYEVKGQECSVEILAEGQQFVASGEHPDTKAKYLWPGDNLLDCPIDALTIVTPDALLDFIAEANNTLSRFGTIKARSFNGSGATANYRFAENELESNPSLIAEAVDTIPNNDLHYDDWIRAAHAIKGATGDAGFDIFDHWSQKSDKYDARETERAWRSIKHVNQIGAGFIYHIAAEYGFDLAAARGRLKGATAPPGNQADAAEPESEPEAPPRFNVRWWGEFKPKKAANDFIEETLGNQQMSVIYGRSNTGKTFFALDMAFHVAAGIPWRGLEVSQGAVIYCALEGAHGLENRMSALEAHFGEDLEDRPQLGAISEAINLLDPAADIDAFIIAIRRQQAKLTQPLRLIVIDTLARALAGGNENSSDDMGALVINIDRIRAETGVHVMIIHHSGKDEARGARGHSSLQAATDTEIEVKRDEEGQVSIAHVTKQREFEGGQNFAFKLIPVDLGVNDRGKVISSCVIEPADVEEYRPKRAKKPSGKNQKTVLRCLQNLLASDAAYPLNEPDYPAVLCVSEGLLQRTVYEQMAGMGVASGHVNSRFYDALNGLIDAGFAMKKGEKLWLAQSGMDND